MAYTDINSEDRLVQATFAEHLEKTLGWDSVYAWNQETFGPRDEQLDAVNKTWDYYQSIKQLFFCKFRELVLRCCARAAVQGFIVR